MNTLGKDEIEFDELVSFESTRKVAAAAFVRDVCSSTLSRRDRADRSCTKQYNCLSTLLVSGIAGQHPFPRRSQASS
jgi:hypothetical protein